MTCGFLKSTASSEANNFSFGKSNDLLVVHSAVTEARSYECAFGCMHAADRQEAHLDFPHKGFTRADLGPHKTQDTSRILSRALGSSGAIFVFATGCLLVKGGGPEPLQESSILSTLTNFDWIWRKGSAGVLGTSGVGSSPAFQTNSARKGHRVTRYGVVVA